MEIIERAYDVLLIGSMLILAVLIICGIIRSVLGSGLILYLNAFGFKKTEEIFTEKRYRRITLAALSFYCLAKSYSFFTGANHIPSGIPLGTPGAIISSGLILPLNICVGMVVACTM